MNTILSGFVADLVGLWRIGIDVVLRFGSIRAEDNNDYESLTIYQRSARPAIRPVCILCDKLTERIHYTRMLVNENCCQHHKYEEVSPSH
jgi:hypothetical protein